jgi:microcystin-dependent protein
VTLTIPQMPPHTHALSAAPDGTTGTPSPSTVLGTPLAAESVYAVPGAVTALSPNAIAPSGGSQPHENRQPFLALNYIVSLFGIFPSQG